MNGIASIERLARATGAGLRIARCGGMWRVVLAVFLLLVPSSAHAGTSEHEPLVQLVAVRTPAAMARAALVHAIGRDAWVEVWRCAHGSTLRGSLRVKLRRAARGASAELVAPVPISHRAATECVLRAIERVHIPPVEVEPPDGAQVEFELVVRGRRLPGPLLLPPIVVAALNAGAQRSSSCSSSRSPSHRCSVRRSIPSRRAVFFLLPPLRASMRRV